MSQIPPRILIVDDDPIIQRLLRLLFVSEGYSVETAPDGSAALLSAAKVAPDLAIVDLAMPIMDGAAFIAALRALDGPHVPVIVLSASPTVATQANAASADDYLRKPFDTDRVVERAEELLRVSSGPMS